VKKLILVLTGVVLLYASCKTAGEPVEPVLSAPVENDTLEQISPPALTAIQEMPEEDVFDPRVITPEVYDTTKRDVQQLIEKLNGIIQSRNYKVWVSYLGRTYFEEINSQDFLRRVSEYSFLKSKNTVLSSVNDYFTHVVVPSRANSRVDDIEFVAQNRVKAFMITAQGQRLRLYELENLGDGWKIVN
jgi:hypothetical protein